MEKKLTKKLFQELTKKYYLSEEKFNTLKKEGWLYSEKLNAFTLTGTERRYYLFKGRHYGECPTCERYSSEGVCYCN